MNPDTLKKLTQEYAEFPNMRADSLPTTDEIAEASEQLGVAFHDDYQQFLREFGGGMVGAYPVFGLRPVPVMGKNRWSVVDVTRQYRANAVPECENWVVISEDHAGNPVGMDHDGVIWTYDHDFGGITKLADNLDAYLRKRCLKVSD